MPLYIGSTIIFTDSKYTGLTNTTNSQIEMLKLVLKDQEGDHSVEVLFMFLI